MRKKILLLFLVLLLVVIILPALLVGILRWPRQPEPQLTGPTIRVYFSQRQVVEQIPLEEYLVGVLAAEMPASFELEALKAQAVAARTYTLKKAESARRKPDTQHPDADICTDPVHCQAWMSRSEMQSRWGMFQYFQYLNKLKRAITETRGEVLYFEGRLIDPVYHSNSGGRTENSEAVWQFEIPYLRSVESPWDREAPRWQEVQSFTLADLDAKLKTKTTSGDNPQLKLLQRTASGRVALIEFGGKQFSGTEFRELLGLKSTNFSWDFKDGRLDIETYGNGHGVGLSQYGANGMAKEGSNYLEILKYYYKGVQIEQR